MEKFKYSQMAKIIRRDILRMSNSARSAHTGGALSCVEILVALYFDVMSINPDKPHDPERDRLIFSKAHDAKALFATLCERGYFTRSILEGYEKDNGLLPGHSTRHCVPGVESSAGSLGHGLPMAVGSAFALKLEKRTNRVFAVISDGECDEGTTWESALFASHHGLDNLTVIVDYNKLQGFGFTKDVLDLEPLTEKWEAFGFKSIEVNGHDIAQLTDALNSREPGKPLVVIAHTVKGIGGVEKYVGTVASQYKPPSDDELLEATKQLGL